MTSKAYSEVWSILNALGETYFCKLPDKLIDFVKREKDDTYNPIYSVEDDFEYQNISEDALNFVTFLNLKYWCDEEEKAEILSVLRENDSKSELKSEIEEQCKADVKFEIEEYSKVVNEEQCLPIVQEKISFKVKVINIIKKIFKRREK